jgi:putative cofactor-binding repeat protein
MGYRNIWRILVVLLTVTASDCLAEINLVQDTSETWENSNSVSATFSHTPTEGNLLVAVAGARVGSAAPTTPAGWTVIISQPTGSPGQIMYYKIAGASESAILTVGPYSNSTSRGLHLYEYSGVDTSDVLEDTASASGSGLSLSSGNVTTADEAMTLAGVMTNANTTISSWSDSFQEWNNFINAGTPTNKSRYGGADWVSIDAGTFSTTATADASGAWIGQAVAFNAAQNCNCTVTTVADSGPGSLRECMTVANNCTGTTIEFDIPGPGNMSDGGDSWWRISPDSALPTLLSRSTTIDGTTQTTNQGDSNSVGPEIEINGDQAGNAHGLAVYRPNNTIEGLVINGFDGTSMGGIFLNGAAVTGNTIQGCYLGTSATGDSAIANYNGLRIASFAANNEIGGTAAGEGNLISGNTGAGVYLLAACESNRLRGNFIGTNATADAAIPNGADGVYVTSNSGVTVGGTNPGEGNVISGNGQYGVRFSSTDNIVLQGTRIGTDSSGTIAVPNGSHGVYIINSDTAIIGGTSAGAGNIISANGGYGIYLAASGEAAIYGNMIGTGPTGSEAGLGNGGDYSILLSNTVTKKSVKIGGLSAGEGNVIADGAFSGIRVNIPGADVEIAGNIIRDHGEHGIESDFDSVSIIGNLIHGNGLDGISFVCLDTTNFIYHNTIHGNGDDGIEVAADSALIKNNIITGNAGFGIRVTIGSISEEHNLVTDDILNPPNALGRSTETLDASDINGDPQYVDTTNGDFSLTECNSPAINGGVDLGADQPDMNGSSPGLYNGPAPDMGAFESSCSSILSVAINNPDFAFGLIPPNQWLTPESSLVINDGTVAQNFVGQVSQFTDGSNTWDIDAFTNGADSVRVQWSTTSDTGPWTDISAYASDFTFATNVAVSDTVVIWFRIQSPVTTSSTAEYSSLFTVTAQEF